MAKRPRETSRNPAADIAAIVDPVGGVEPDLPPQGRPGGPLGLTLRGKRIVLVISGGIAFYKSLDLIRRLRERGAEIRAIMTRAAEEFVTPLAVGALTGNKVFTELFDRNDEHDVGHIRLARDADLIVIAPATADILARMAAGRAD